MSLVTCRAGSLHPSCRINCIPEETITRDFKSDNPCYCRSRVKPFFKNQSIPILKAIFYHYKTYADLNG